MQSFVTPLNGGDTPSGCPMNSGDDNVWCFCCIYL